ncbi:MAG: Fis family transcriptional regulator [Marivita sp.]|uniref:Fis family transcriptional regulator n=1 Tax=Pseudooceanicola pacificus TaxID=2676438 RepID=A0A844W950_9RHOB|nr:MULTISPECIES: Fis family transcriptional regulator [Rhodobacterales]MAA99083.1 Fis family transcriptional regulator [Stappia sp.]MBB98857.1 Fis family transcriptional regulator [Paracoccaceae bacterium]MCI5112716.1 Fis family transcriptional regulator [Marivita sp.]MWB79695.1 Fis family transcriptional regulator [Pseudooceanicola pacificus]
MTAADDWFAAFPIQPATEAVEALCQAWTELAERPRPDFNPKTNEAALTKRLKVYIENYTARERGLLGMWAAEDIIGEIDPATGAMIEERRTDIVYGWNDSTQDLKFVFEFKRLGRQKRHRDHYLRENGLARFVTGIYSRRQAVAAMVGVLLDPEPDVVPPIREMLSQEEMVAELKLRPAADGLAVIQPSALFSAADFDTEHERDPTLAPSHGHIRVAHFFLPFGYPTTTKKPKGPKV